MKIDWWLTGICASRAFGTMVFITYAAALPVLRSEWGMTAAAAGAIVCGWQVGYAISMVALSWLADRVGPKPVYLWSTTIGAVFSMAFALMARGFLSAIVLYTLVGVSLAGTYTTGLMILSDRYPAHRRGKATGLYIASSSFGFALSLFLSGIAIPLGGYRLSFIITCTGPLLAAILLWPTLAKTPLKVSPRLKGQRFAKEVLYNPPAMYLIASYSCHNWELQGMRAWMPAFLFSCLAVRGVDTFHAAGFGAYVTAGFHLSALAAAFSMGTLSDRLGRARVLILLAGMSTVCSFSIGWLIDWPLALVVIIGTLYAFSSLGDSPVLSTALTEVVAPPYLGSAFGLRSLIGFGAGAVAPLLFGAVLDWTNAFETGMSRHSSWGWAFGSLGIAGLGAVWAATRFARLTAASQGKEKQK